jgi:hypothetical protein
VVILNNLYLEDIQEMCAVEMMARFLGLASRSYWKEKKLVGSK